MAKKKRTRKDSGWLTLIKDIEANYNISVKEIEELSNIDHPLFSFRYLKKSSIEDCKEPSFFYNFLMRLQKLSELGWDGIRRSQRHSFGMEKIPVEQLATKNQLPSFVTREADVDVFRASGDNRVFVGIQKGKIFYIFFIEAKFGDICTH